MDAIRSISTDFGFTDSPNCPVCSDTPEDVGHVMFHYPKMERRNLNQALEKKDEPEECNCGDAVNKSEVIPKWRSRCAEAGERIQISSQIKVKSSIFFTLEISCVTLIKIIGVGPCILYVSLKNAANEFHSFTKICNPLSEQ